MSSPDSSAGEGTEARLKQRAVHAEINGRRVNEAIERGDSDGGTAVFVCECGYVGCNTTVQLSIAEYEAVRTDFDRFLVVPGHEIDEIEQVVERHPDHLVVVKREPDAKTAAHATDERTP
ncbi:MAG TPA: hypothetical protein VFI17_00835 [Solirubrobacterales bacterium]|nr:hypothetical protein [Solirubrobacterales bacterium]